MLKTFDVVGFIDHVLYNECKKPKMNVMVLTIIFSTLKFSSKIPKTPVKIGTFQNSDFVAATLELAVWVGDTNNSFNCLLHFCLLGE